MSTPINIGGMSIPVPGEHNTNITQLIEELTNAHESGQLEALVISYVAGEQECTALLGRRFLHAHLLANISRVAELQEDVKYSQFMEAAMGDDDADDGSDENDDD